ncbi:hypothetical protein G6F36_012283 [Rhizopus arrhizus]|nr:hypothetical protein G6F36_012283 [Rhizopus arrhizus]
MFKRLFSTLVRSPAVEQLENLHKLVQSVNNTPSTHQKRRLLAENPACHSILKRIYSPHVRHYISSKRALAYIHQHPTIGSTSYYTQLDQLLDALSSRTITGHEALKAVSAFYAAYCQTQPHQDIFWRVIDRNLKMGVSEQTVRHLLLHDNSSSKDFSPCQIKVALAHSLGKRKLKLDEADWYASQKLDGVRCISMIRFDPNQNTHNIQFLSRTGRPFYSLQKVELDLEKRLKEMEIKQDFVLDGEVCAYNAAGENEVFGVAVSQIRKMNETMKEPLYHIFDYIPMSVFLDGFGDVTFSQRQRYLETFVDNKDQSLKHINIVSQHKLKNSKELERMKEKAVENNWEGLILRRDAPYEGKRTNNLLKVKEWEDAEYIVNGVETNYMRMPDTGENKLVLKNVNIEHKGNIVSVGSGFSMNERIAFAENPSLIIGKAITVRYFSESVNKNGTISLRFPSIKAIYENSKRDI